MKKFKQVLAAVLAGVIAVGSLSLSAYTVKADEAAAADDAVVEDNSAFALQDVTKIEFIKNFEDKTIHFQNEFVASPYEFVDDMNRAWKSGHGISWLFGTVIDLTDKEGNKYRALYDGDEKEYSEVKAHMFSASGMDISNIKDDITFVHTDITAGGGDLNLIDLFGFLSRASSKDKYKGTYTYGKTKIDSVVANADGSFSVKMDNQAYTFFEQNDVLYAQGDVTAYSAIVVWKKAGVLKATYIPEARVNVYRIYNPNSGEHFYTTNKKEAEDAVKAGWNDEGSLCMAPKASNVPVYRLFNPNARDAGSHHFTISSKERADLVKAGWVDEGVAFYSVTNGKGVKLLRAYNKNDGGHNFTISEAEQKKIVEAGWADEGLAWYVYPLGK